MVWESEIFGLMGRMHVILRRVIGRVTDVDYMSRSPDYCREVLSLAHHTNHHELVELANQLEPLLFGPDGVFAEKDRRPLIDRWRDKRSDSPAEPLTRYHFGPRGA